MRLAPTALAIGLVSMAGSAFPASVTVHSNGVSGNYASIGAALAAVQSESPGPGNADVITILNEGPFREGALVISGDAHANHILIHAANGVRPIVVSTSTGANAIEIRKNGRAEIRDLIIIPAHNISQTATRAILYQAPTTGSTGYDYHLQNILISSNNGKDRPVAGLDGLGSPLFNPNRHVSFRGDAGIRGNSTDNTNVYKMNLRSVVVSSLQSDAPYGLRSFQDGAPGSELAIGEGCVFSRINSNTTEGAAINLGGMLGAPSIGRIQGSEGAPVLVTDNGVPGLYMTGTDPESYSIANTIFARNKREAIFIVNPQLSGAFANVTVVGNTRYAMRLANNDGSALNFAGSVTVTDSIIAGNGSVVVTNAIQGALAAAGSLTFTNSALVHSGPYRLNQFYPNGINVTGSGTVTLENVTNADPRFVTINPLYDNFAMVTADEYASAGSAASPLSGAGQYDPLGGRDNFAWYFHD